jgi:hypothetical protein
MLKQGVFPFCYECEATESGMTVLAGLPSVASHNWWKLDLATSYTTLLSISEMVHFLNRTLSGNQIALTSSLWA